MPVTSSGRDELSLVWRQQPAEMIAGFDSESRDVPDGEDSWFLDLVVNGAWLQDAHGDHRFISPLGHGALSYEEEAARRLLLEWPPDVGDRVAVFVCAACGDLRCGAISFRIERDGADIVWSDPSYTDAEFEGGRARARRREKARRSPLWVHEPLDFVSTLRFSQEAYRAVILNRPPPRSVPFLGGDRPPAKILDAEVELGDPARWRQAVAVLDRLVAERNYYAAYVRMTSTLLTSREAPPWSPEAYAIIERHDPTTAGIIWGQWMQQIYPYLSSADKARMPRPNPRG